MTNRELINKIKGHIAELKGRGNDQPSVAKMAEGAIIFSEELADVENMQAAVEEMVE
jgi:hypothetical protein